MQSILKHFVFLITLASISWLSAAEKVAQKEEGFRWRAMCSFSSRNQIEETAQAQHEEMGSLEKSIILEVKDSGRNILFAKLSIVFQTKGGTIGRVSDWIRWIPEESEDIKGGVALFVSGSEELKTRGTSSFKDCEVNGNAINGGLLIRDFLEKLFESKKGVLNDSLRQKRLTEVKTKKKGAKPNPMFTQWYHHTEQWLMIYLEAYRGGQKVIKRLVDRLIAEAAKHNNRDRGKPHDSAPPTPPGIRVRTAAVQFELIYT